MPTIHDNLSQLQASIHLLEAKYQRAAHSVSLLAMSKGRTPEQIQAAFAAGQIRFGENYVQEALKKMEALQNPKLEWHFTGTLQSNKTRPIAEQFAWVHTVTSIKLAQRLSEQRPPELQPLNVCIEVNVSAEPSKSGLLHLDEVKSLAQCCLTLPRLKLRGLMTIPKPSATLEQQRAELHRLVVIKDQLNQAGMNLDTLSMGMTDDLEAAIAEGATLLRIGRAIFGERLQK